MPEDVIIARSLNDKILQALPSLLYLIIIIIIIISLVASIYNAQPYGILITVQAFMNLKWFNIKLLVLLFEKPGSNPLNTSTAV